MILTKPRPQRPFAHIVIANLRARPNAAGPTAFDPDRSLMGPIMLKSFRIPMVMGATLLSLAACQSADNAATAVKSAAQAQTTPTLSTTDTTFLNMAGTAGIEEVTFGQLAETKAGSPAVRKFATQMVNDHTAANQQLMALAQRKQITPPSAMDTAHDQALQQLQGLRGRAFDRAYMQGQVQDHMAVVQAFETEIQSGTDTDVVAFAQQNLPVMQRHLQMAQALAPKH